jgi:hypothetical protein
MSDFDISNLLDEDQVEITDLDQQDDGSSASFSLQLLKFTRKIPLFANTRARSTTLALLACVFVLLFLMQPGSPTAPRQTPRTSELASSYAVDVQSPLSIIGTPSTHNVTWIKTSIGKVIVFQASTGTIGWHQCKVQRRSTPPNYAHPTLVICT